jgi:hypothetical protein
LSRGLGLALMLAPLLALQARTPPPRVELDRAERAVQRAREAGASSAAEVELRAAMSYLEASRLAREDRKRKDEIALAARAELEAELATALTRAVQARQAVEEKAEANARLRRELLGEMPR